MLIPSFMMASVCLSSCLLLEPYREEATDDTATPPSDGSEELEQGSTPTSTPATLKPPPPPEDGPYADPTCDNGRVAVVEYVADGDTIILRASDGGEDEERVRLIGIDTPELGYDGAESECYAEEAKAATHAWVDNQTICLTYDPAVTVDTHGTNQDTYGRTLAYVFFGESYSQFLNADLLSEGYAEDYPFTDGAAFEDYFYELEAYAKALELGRWEACGDTEKH